MIKILHSVAVIIKLTVNLAVTSAYSVARYFMGMGEIFYFRIIRGSTYKCLHQNDYEAAIRTGYISQPGVDTPQRPGGFPISIERGL